MSGDAGWTLESYVAHNEALRQAQKDLDAERDRRYLEVERERERGRSAKMAADAEALRLARTAQAYRDERDNRLREQINLERGSYATKTELDGFRDHYDSAHKPLADFVSGQIGRREGIGSSTAILYAVLVLAVAVISAVILFANYRTGSEPPRAVTVTVPATK